MKVEGNKGHLVFFSHTTFVDGGGGGVLLCNIVTPTVLFQYIMFLTMDLGISSLTKRGIQRLPFPCYFSTKILS